MRKVIYKYPLKFTGDQDIKMPGGAVILSIQLQDGALMLWAMVPSEPTDTQQLKTFIIIATGQQFIFENLTYISTFITSDFLVFHVFEDTSTQ